MSASLVFDLMRQISTGYFFGKEATNAERPADQRVANGMGAVGSGLQAAATLTPHLGGSAALASGLGWVGGPLAAGALGYKMGTELDRVTGLSDAISDGLNGIDGHLEDSGMIAQRVRGTAGIDEANRALAERETRKLVERLEKQAFEDRLEENGGGFAGLGKTVAERARPGGIAAARETDKIAAAREKTDDHIAGLRREALRRQLGGPGPWSPFSGLYD